MNGIVDCLAETDISDFDVMETVLIHLSANRIVL